MSTTPPPSTQSSPSSVRDGEMDGVISLEWPCDDGKAVTVLLGGDLNLIASLAVMLSNMTYIHIADNTTRVMEYWDDDALAGELVRATVAYLASRKGRVRP